MYKYIILWYYDPETGKPVFRAGVEINMDKYETGLNKLKLYTLQFGQNMHELLSDESIKETLLSDKDIKYVIDITETLIMLKLIKTIQCTKETIFDVDESLGKNWKEMMQENFEYFYNLLSKYENL